MQEQRKCVDSLRISEEEQRAIVAELESACRTPRAADKRRARRYRYSVREGLRVEVEGARAAFVVRPRNLSTGGVSVLHGSFLYPGTGCAVTLRAIDGRQVRVPGRVVRCRCVRGRVHEVGVQFDDPIRVEDFLAVTEAEHPESDSPADAASDAGYPSARVVELARQLQELAAAEAPRQQLYRKLAQLVALLRDEQVPGSQPK